MMQRLWQLAGKHEMHGDQLMALFIAGMRIMDMG